MKNSFTSLLLVVCAFGVASAQTYGLDNADPALFTKFRVPETSLSALWFNGSFNFGSNKLSISNPVAPNTDNANTSLNFQLVPQYNLLQESDSRYLEVNADANGSYSRSYSGSEGPGYAPNSYYKNYNDYLSVSASETYRNYPSLGGFFYSLGSTANFNGSAQYTDQRTSDTTRQTSYYGSKGQNYSVSIGIGWGKMRDVTSVVSAIRFQERLKQLNLLDRDLSEKAIEDLAQEFYREGYYSNIHVRPDKFFWQDVQTTLSGDGVSLAGLNQSADSYVREVPNEIRFFRNEGVVGGINLQVNYVNTYGSGEFYRSGISEYLLLLGNAYVTVSHQLNLNSQVNFALSLSGGPNVVKDSPIEQQYGIIGAIGYDYEITDRVVASANNQLTLGFENASVQEKNLLNTLSLSLNYFVEDNISLQVTYGLNYIDEKNQQYVGYHRTESDNSVRVGITYYIQRGFLYK